MTTLEKNRLDLYDKDHTLNVRAEDFKNFRNSTALTYMRNVTSPAGREVTVIDPFSGEDKQLLMFASNNYLGLANHPRVKQAIKKSIDIYGCGIGGPPLLNGYLKLTKETEERLADLKGQESAMLFSSGFLANLGVVSALAQHNDIIFFDELNHASFYDGLRLTKAKAIMFPHNDTDELERLIKLNISGLKGDIYIFTEGVFSMDGDLGKLKKITELCQIYGAKLILDDAHGTGVIGPNGKGTAAHLNCEDKVDVLMGTFSKVFATCGGFLAGSGDIIDYMRFHCRSYVFSAAIPPTITSAVLAGLDVIEKEPWLQQRLLDIAAYGIKKLSRFDFFSRPEAAIIALKLPEYMDIRKAAFALHQKGLFINSIEYPAVPLGEQRFRISFMADHTEKDIDRLAESLDEVWNDQRNYNYPQ